MPTLIVSNTTSTDGTEQTLTTQTTNANYVFAIDTANMALGDTIEVKIKTKMLSVDSAQLAWEGGYSDAQGIPNKYSDPVPSDTSITVTIKRVSGTDRSYKWKLLAL